MKLFCSSMVLLKMKVQCYFCRNEVDKLTARQLETDRREPRYECFACFKKGLQNKTKQQYFCEKCKYRFLARSAICPYCNQRDYVSLGKLNTSDLLR